MTTPSAKLSAHLAAVRFEDLSPLAVERAKWCLLDWLAVVLAASGMGEGAEAFMGLARGYEAMPEAHVVGGRFATTAPMAALANGAMAHAMDFGDTYDKAPLHPNSPLIPALLAISEKLGGVDGRTFITAMAVGCDLTCRLGLALRDDPARFGWYTPPILGAYGAAAAVGKVLGLDADGMLDALSLVLCQATCSAEIKRSPRSHIRAVRDAFAAQAGYQAALIAQAGIKGFDLPFEGQAGLFQLITRTGPDEAALLDGLGAKFHGEDISFKLWPSCRGTHAYIEAGRLILAERAVRPEDIAAIHLVGSPVQTMLIEPLTQKQAPRTAIDAKFSLPFTVASAFVHGDVDFDSFSAAALVEPRVLEVARKVTFEAQPEKHQGGVEGELFLTLASGEQLSRFVEFPLGSPRNPIDEAMLVGKFMGCAARARTSYEQPRLDAVVETVLNLERASDVGTALFSARTL